MPEPAKINKCPEDKDLYGDVPYCRGSVSLPGTRNHFFYIKRSFITKWPKPKEVKTNLKDAAVLDGDFVLQADKKWLKVDTVPNKSKLNPEQVGQIGGKHFKNKIVLPIPGTEELATGLINELANEDAVFLIPQRNGKYRLIGNNDFMTEIVCSQDTGEGSDDQNSTNIEISCEDSMAAPFYPGKIATTDGDISGLTGELILSPSLEMP